MSREMQYIFNDHRTHIIPLQLKKNVIFSSETKGKRIKWNHAKSMKLTNLSH